jgi:SET domain-containing protein
MVENVIVKKSKAHGRGVFAARNFKEGETVLACGLGKTMTHAKACTLPLEEWAHVYALGRDQYVLLKSPACFFNHSCRPNVSFDHSRYTAAKDINKGDELVVDYEKGHMVQHFLCKCGHKHCREVITGH